MIADSNVAIAVFADVSKSDTWIKDTSIALNYMDLMAANQGIGSCWTQMHTRFSTDKKESEEVARQILDLEDNYKIIGILSLGLPA